MNGPQGPGNLLKLHVVFVNDIEARAFIGFSVGFVTQKRNIFERMSISERSIRDPRE